jgi:hypothetical protein
MFVAKVHEGLPDTQLTVMTEADVAWMRAEEGDTVVQHDGRHWRTTFPGFYQPVHLLARLRAAEITRPALLCWGCRAALVEEDAHLANGSLPIYLMADLGHFGEGVLNRNRRSDLRRCRRQVELRRLRDASLLVEQGHAVFMSAVRRLGYWRPQTEDQYRRRVDQRAGHGRRLIIAGLVDGRLAGYLDSFAVDGVLYPEEIFVATDALRTGIGTGLYVESIETARQAGLRVACNGLHTPEDADLCRFKEGLGFRLVHLPARTVIPAPIRAYIRARRPATHYRLTGVKPPLPTYADE